MGKKVMIAAFAAMALMAGTAQARGPALSQERADSAAARDVAGWVQAERADGDEFTITGVEIDPCEIEPRQRVAYCDATMFYSDGVGCDLVIRVASMRRGRLHVTEPDLFCDDEES